MYSHKYFSKLEKYKINIKKIKDENILIDLYNLMKKLRLYELAIKKEYHPADKMRCPVHLCIGQEAIPAALYKLTNEVDYIFSHHRSHGYYFASKSNMKYLISELHGKIDGASGGLAGSQDISFSDNNFYSGAILGGVVGIAVGVAASIKMGKDKCQCVVGFGEACSEEGVFWEAINYTALENLPILFICENNKYATYSDQMKRQPKDNICDKVSSFGVKSLKIFGNDVVEVYLRLKEILTEISFERKPVFIEAYTYRMNSHVGPEDDSFNNYRSIDEINHWKKLCPVKLMEEALLEQGIIDEKYIRLIDNEIQSVIKSDFENALNAELPTLNNWDELNYNRSRYGIFDEMDVNTFDYNQNETKIVNY